MCLTFGSLICTLNQKFLANLRIIERKNKIFRKKSYLCTLKIDECTNLYVKMLQEICINT